MIHHDTIQDIKIALRANVSEDDILRHITENAHGKHWYSAVDARLALYTAKQELKLEQANVK
jgi:hypothetical protein